MDRTCTCCGLVKSISEFAKNGVDKDGSTRYRTDCKACYNISRKERRTKKKHSDFIGGQKRRSSEVIDYSFEDWKASLIYFSGACAYCGIKPKHGQRLTRDHVEPVVRGGTTSKHNIVPACRKCNCSKGHEEVGHWYRKQTFFKEERLEKIKKWRDM